jgi:predicted nucleotidyltransferase component of viral defense system
MDGGNTSMSVRIIQQRLENYNCNSEVEEQHAIREITQEVILAALGRGDFFKYVLFRGGTCLRIFYGLNRFSEDLDFVLQKPNRNFQMKDNLLRLSDELSAYGYDIEVVDREKADSTVKKAFLKDSSLGKVLKLKYSTPTGPTAKIRIKIEIDTNPPSGSGQTLQYMDFPFVSSVVLQDKPSLFAGKIHALLCRSYVKGRDWYDFIWYTSTGIGINYAFLSSAINQNGPWKNLGVRVDKYWVINELTNRINILEWKQVAEDVRSFVHPVEQPSLELWSKDLFLRQVRKLEKTLGK